VAKLDFHRPGLCSRIGSSLAALLPALCMRPWFLGAIFLSICRTRRALVFFGPHLGSVFQAAGFCHSQSLVGLSISNRLVPGGSVRQQKSPLAALFSSVDLSGFSGNQTLSSWN
jgi:hypothetical protein